MSDQHLLTRREFTLESALAILAAATITITGCGDDDDNERTGPSGQGEVGTISVNHGHTATITAAQITAGGALSVDIRGTATTPTRSVSPRRRSCRSARTSRCQSSRRRTTSTTTRSRLTKGAGGKGQGARGQGAGARGGVKAGLDLQTRLYVVVCDWTNAITRVSCLKAPAPAHDVGPPERIEDHAIARCEWQRVPRRNRPRPHARPAPQDHEPFGWTTRRATYRQPVHRCPTVTSPCVPTSSTSPTAPCLAGSSITG